jgi:hypothetical protein
VWVFEDDYAGLDKTGKRSMDGLLMMIRGKGASEDEIAIAQRFLTNLSARGRVKKS